MGLSDSRHLSSSSSQKKQSSSAGNMHLFFFDVYKNTVNIINPSSSSKEHEGVSKRFGCSNSDETNRKRFYCNEVRHVVNRNDDGGDEGEFDSNFNPKTIEDKLSPAMVDGGDSLQTTVSDDNEWDSNHNAVVPAEDIPNISPDWSPEEEESESPGSAGHLTLSPIKRVDSGICDVIMESDEGEGDSVVVTSESNKRLGCELGTYKSFPTRPFRNKTWDNPTSSWDHYPSFPMPSWHRKSQQGDPRYNNSNDNTPFWCSCSNPYCNYTCHTRCRALVALDCKTQDTEEGEEASASPLLEEIHCEESDQSLFASSPVAQQDLHRKIEAYNATTAAGNEMTLSEDGHVSGFIRVHMNLCRPINVVSGVKPMSLFDVIRDDDSTEKTLTSFYLPRDTIKSLHITSETTTQEVISALLRKYKVVDNPHKFALYERYYENGESIRVKMRRIQEGEHPLLLALMCGDAKTANQQFVLQENDTGDISWEAFSLPELNNFLKILEREEDEYVNQVRLKYKILEEKIREAMEFVESTGEAWQPEGLDELALPESEQSYQNLYNEDKVSQSASFPRNAVIRPNPITAEMRHSSTIAVSGLSNFNAARLVKASACREQKNLLNRPENLSDSSTLNSTDVYNHLSSSSQLLDVS